MKTRIETGRLSGVIAAAPTPFDASGAPNLTGFLEHATWALENGCDGLNVLGTTGEATSQSLESRTRVMRTAADSLAPSRLMVGTGAADFDSALRLTKTAAECGFAGALILPPFYYKGVSDEGLLAWFAGLIEGTASEPVPIYLYNFPQMTGIVFSPDFAARLKAAFPERVQGAKDSSGDLAYATALTGIDDFDVFPSNEAVLHQGRAKGFAGCISATINIAVRTSAQLWREQSDDAALEQAVRVRAMVSAQPLVPAVKHLVGRRLRDSAWDRVLPPRCALSPDQAAQLVDIDLDVV